MVIIIPASFRDILYARKCALLLNPYVDVKVLFKRNYEDLISFNKVLLVTHKEVLNLIHLGKDIMYEPIELPDLVKRIKKKTNI